MTDGERLEVYKTILDAMVEIRKASVSRYAIERPDLVSYGSLAKTAYGKFCDWTRYYERIKDGD